MKPRQLIEHVIETMGDDPTREKLEQLKREGLIRDFALHPLRVAVLPELSWLQMHEDTGWVYRTPWGAMRLDDYLVGLR